MSAFRANTRREVLCGLVAAPMAAESAMTSAAEVINPPIALWVWGDRILMPDRLGAFADAHNVDSLYLYVSPAAAQALLAGQPPALRALAAMRGGARRIYGVCGEPDWTTDLAQLPQHAALLIRLATTTSLFDGLHFDVEPQGQPGWSDPTKRASLIAGTLKFYDLVCAATPNVEVDAAVNPVFSMLQSGSQTFMTALAARVRSVSVMAYRSTVARAMEWAGPSIEEIQLVGRPWRMGVLVDADPGESGTSWYGSPSEKFMSGMVNLNRAILFKYPHSGYLGLAIEDYDGLLAMFEK